MPVWPAGPRFLPITPTYSEIPVDGALRTAMDTGPEKTRQRYTATPVNVNFALVPMTRTEYATFKTFFDVDLEGGALAFDATHPITCATEQFRFRRPYQVRAIGNLVQVSVELELLP